jgi:hypothetical protein
MKPSLKHNLAYYIKFNDIKSAIQLVGTQSLIKECFEGEDPIRFMDDYTGISSIVNDEGMLIYKDSFDNVIFFTTDLKSPYTFFAHGKIWQYFATIKGMMYDDIQELLSKWLHEYYPELGNTTAGNSFRYDK